LSRLRTKAAGNIAPSALGPDPMSTEEHGREELRLVWLYREIARSERAPTAGVATCGIGLLFGVSAG